MLRRSILKALCGGALTLPFAGLFAKTADAGPPPAMAKRFIVFYFPDGVPAPAGQASRFHATGSETAFTLPENLAPLAAHKSSCIFLRGLSMGATDAGSHPGGAKKLLTGVDGGGGESLDRYLARTAGASAPFRHLYLGAMAVWRRLCLSARWPGVKVFSYFLGSCVLLAAAACASAKTDVAAPAVDAPEAGAPDPGASFPTQTLGAETQRNGDAAKGYRALVNEAYVPCGIPYSAYSQVFGAASEENKVPGREGRNATLAYNFTSMKTKDGVELVTSNCLTCHAGRINGKLVVGLGASDGDFTQDAATQMQTTGYVGLLLTDAKERAEWTKWKERVDTVAPYSVLSTRGVNPADGFTAVLFAHHDPKTMAWSSKPLMDVPPPLDVPVDVPPWWRMKKKSSMFYVGGGRGDHARIMMTASILCTSSVEESRAIDAYFADIRTWIASLDAPAYPFAIDRALADRGRPVFEATCSRCHGTYGADARYPNRLISTEEIQTDPVLASGAAQFAGPFVDWYKKSFFGEIARLEPQKGYVAPPLDGIWATAPYLHNGSVPTLAALLDSTQRPKYWTRSFVSTDFDQAGVGWRFTPGSHGKDAEADATAKKALYDTTRLGYSNAGHTFGDGLSAPDRTAVIEYLKTL